MPHQCGHVHDGGVDPDMADQRPGKAGEHIGARHLDGGEGGHEGQRRAAQRPRCGPCPGPEQGKARRHAHQREGRHPAVAFGGDHEGFDDPEQRQREIAGACGPADQRGAAGAVALAQQEIEQRQTGDREKPQIEGGLPQGPERACNGGQTKLAAQSRAAGEHLRRQTHAAGGPSGA